MRMYVSRAKRGVGDGQGSHLPIHKNGPFPFWLRRFEWLAVPLRIGGAEGLLDV